MQTRTPPPAAYDLVEVELGGKTHRLLASFYAIRRIKERTGYDLRRLESLAEWNVDHLPVMLFELLQHEAEPPSLEQVERAFDLRSADYLAGKVFEAIGVDIFQLVQFAEEVQEVADRGDDPLDYVRRTARTKQKRPARRRSS